MDTQKKSQRRGSGDAGTENTITVVEINRVLGLLEPLYTMQAQKAARDAWEMVDRMLSTGTFAPEDVNTLVSLEDVLRGGPDRIEAAREDLAELRSRL